MPLSQYFRLMDVMARMALRADASRFFLGYIWWVLEPLLWVGVFYVVFVIILGSRSEDFLPFLMVGKLSFVWFSKSITQASNSIVAGKGLVGKINVPKTLFPMAMVHEGLYRQAAVFLMMFLYVLIDGYSVTSAWFYLLPVMVVNYVMIIACALVGACAVCMARDFSPLIGLGMMFLMFTSGVFWNVRDLDPAKAEMVLALNPLAFMLDAYRQILLVGIPPDMGHLLSIGAGFGALLCVMVLVMRRASHYLALKALTA
ncbi:MAG: ABC transporter permease [Proteobacteria bacterium]|jgi:lipopolysaccharide transport system permease protein|nr:ABC transporter permease [Halieaceae bacterium]MCP4827277.1 ABC transporter permease [Pseudomonadota bacterium]